MLTSEITCFLLELSRRRHDQSAIHRCAYILAGPRRRKRPPCGRSSRRTSPRPNTCGCLALIRHSEYFPLLSTRGWGNDRHRPPSVVASIASFSCIRPSCHLSVVRAPARMRAPLLGQTAVFAALLALSTCLTGKKVLRRAAAVAHVDGVKM